MTTSIFAHEALVKETKVSGPCLDDMAETIRADALTLAREKLGLPQHGSNLVSLLRQPGFDYFKYGLAMGVSNALAANDPNVQAIYAYDPSTNADSETEEEITPDATVHLLVQVTMPSAALQAFIASLDRALLASLKDLPSPRFAQRESVLNVNLITEDDIRHGANFAGLLSGVFAPPLKIWQRA